MQILLLMWPLTKMVWFSFNRNWQSENISWKTKEESLNIVKAHINFSCNITDYHGQYLEKMWFRLKVKGSEFLKSSWAQPAPSTEAKHNVFGKVPLGACKSRAEHVLCSNPQSLPTVILTCIKRVYFAIIIRWTTQQKQTGFPLE
jgi:hypothetical protein